MYLDWVLISAAAALAGLAIALAFWLVRRSALRALEGPEPTAAEFAAAAQAGKQLAAKGTVGLVLAGGGAKGAYQVGCWKALRQCGVTQFGPIAGTSVGALNAVLVAQDDFSKAETIWREMSFGRVLRLRWYAAIAIAIRLVLFVPYLVKLRFSARFIPPAMWRAVNAYRAAQGDFTQMLKAVWPLYRAFLGHRDSTNVVGNVLLAIISLGGLSVWWAIAAPIVEIAVMVVLAPLVLLLVVTYSSWLVEALHQASTRLVLATNQPLHQLLLNCVDISKLQGRDHPLFVTLASLSEVHRTILPHLDRPAPIAETAPCVEAKPETAPEREPIRTGWRRWWHENMAGHLKTEPDFLVGAPQPSFEPEPQSVTSIEYAPTHFDLNRVPPTQIHELVLQSAGLPEIFPARRIGSKTYVDGGIVDNVPLAALARRPGFETLGCVVVMPLDAALDEAAIKKTMAGNLERLGAASPAVWPKLLVLTPACPLGGFATGTLDFSAARARALLDAGYRDTIKLLARQTIGPTSV